MITYNTLYNVEYIITWYIIYYNILDFTFIIIRVIGTILCV